MNRKKAVLAGALGLCLAPSLHAAHYDVVLMAGQSNMTGRATSTGLSSPLDSPQSDVAFYYNSNQALTNTTDQSTWTTLRPGSGTDIGPELSFGRTVADALPAQNLALVKHATGGTALWFEWAAPTGGEYISFVNTVNASLSALTDAGHTYTIQGMLWTQGESDGTSESTSTNYERRLNNLIANVRSTFGDDLPFFISRLSAEQASGWGGGVFSEYVNNVRTAQANVAAADANAYLIDTDGFGLKGDSLHFDQAGQIALGEAFATSYLSVVPEPGTIGLLATGVLLVARRRRD